MIFWISFSWTLFFVCCCCDVNFYLSLWHSFRNLHFNICISTYIFFFFIICMFQIRWLAWLISLNILLCRATIGAYAKNQLCEVETGQTNIILDIEESRANCKCFDSFCHHFLFFAHNLFAVCKQNESTTCCELVNQSDASEKKNFDIWSFHIYYWWLNILRASIFA